MAGPDPRSPNGRGHPSRPANYRASLGPRTLPDAGSGGPTGRLGRGRWQPTPAAGCLRHMKPLIAGFPNGLVPFHRPIHMTIGTYDGVHKGHQALLKTLIGGAKAAGAESMVVTFDPHPRCVLDPNNCPASLTVLDERIWLLE